MLRRAVATGLSRPVRAAAMSSLSPAASATGVPGFAFDIDGVLLRGPAAVPRAAAALRAVQAAGVPYCFLTNGGGVHEADKARDLAEILGVRVDQHRVILAHTPMRGLATELGDAGALLVGMGDVDAVAQAYGFKHCVHVEEYARQHPQMVPLNRRAGMGPPHSATAFPHPVRAVLVLSDPLNWELAIQVILDVMRGDRGNPHQHLPRDAPSQTQLYLSNPDLLWASDFHIPRLGQGAFRVALQAVYQHVYQAPLPFTQFGKPHTVQYRFAEHVLTDAALRDGIDRATVFYGIGDNPDADIAGANAAGSDWHSVLVRTGVFDDPSLANHPVHPANLVCDDVYSAVCTVLARHGLA